MAKKLTPGKGGAKGMHKGHAYKPECMCAICKSKRKKLSSENTDKVIDVNGKPLIIPQVVEKTVPVFHQTVVNETEYRIDVTYKGITKDNYVGEYDADKKELTVTIDNKFKKTFVLKNADEVQDVVTNISGDVLTILIPRKQVVELNDKTIEKFADAVQPEQEIKREPKKEPVQEKTEQAKEPEPVSLQGDIIITDETFRVMNSKGGQLSRAFNLQAGFDHGKFMNELVNRSIVYYCNALK